MSRPTSDLDRKNMIPPELLSGIGERGSVLRDVRARVSHAEDLFLFRDLHSERLQDLALRVETAAPPRLDAVDGERGQPGFARELGLAHHQRLPDLAHVVRV